MLWQRIIRDVFDKTERTSLAVIPQTHWLGFGGQPDYAYHTP